ncbi:hypothetical protein [Novosphingobium sp. KA1]|uniref:hypothetical protein n=1 Tax=Novosphingobium sp. (strain KA1) TaxID=164608 RepID=UPI001A8FC88B|nr:hypothetical protein [Novosphingobium sp. KA1]
MSATSGRCPAHIGTRHAPEEGLREIPLDSASLLEAWIGETERGSGFLYQAAARPHGGLPPTSV